MKPIRRDIDKVSDAVMKGRITTPRIVMRDRAGNTLYCRFVKSRGTVQWLARNSNGKLVDEHGVAHMLGAAGYFTKRPGRSIKATSAKGRRVMRLARMK